MRISSSTAAKNILIFSPEKAAGKLAFPPVTVAVGLLDFITHELRARIRTLHVAVAIIRETLTI